MTAAAARELGLAPGTAVATSLFNADAGWLGSILCHEGDQTQRLAENRVSARRAIVRARRSSAAPASARCDRRPCAASCCECRDRYPRRCTLYMYVVQLYVAHVRCLCLLHCSVYCTNFTTPLLRNRWIMSQLFVYGDGECLNELLSRWIVSLWIVGKMSFDAFPKITSPPPPIQSAACIF